MIDEDILRIVPTLTVIVDETEHITTVGGTHLDLEVATSFEWQGLETEEYARCLDAAKLRVAETLLRLR